MDKEIASIDDLLSQATAAVLVAGAIKGTAWLVSEAGFMLTAGHLLGTASPLEKVEVWFADDIPMEAQRVQWAYQPETGADFAVLKLPADDIKGRRPLPVSLARSVDGPFRLLGYGQSLGSRSMGKGIFLGPFDRQNSTDNRVFKLESRQIGEGGYSGGAVFSDLLGAVVALQTSATGKTVTRAERDTVLAMPLFRIAASWEPLRSLAGAGQERASLAAVAQQAAPRASRADLSAMQVDVELFCGREQELAELAAWLTQDRCRVVAILGVGGIGKTSCAAKLLEATRSEFQYLFWRELTNAPPVETILQDCIKLLSEQQQLALTGALDQDLQTLMGYLQRQRCLLVLDNFESVLESGTGAGLYKEGYEGYGQLLQAVGKLAHQSCVIITGRERPKELALLEGKKRPVRAKQLKGLAPDEIRQLVQEQGRDLTGSGKDWHALAAHYAGNPLILSIVTSTIEDVHGGDIAAFLSQANRFEYVESFLDQQFARLPELAQQIMFWLAVAREPVDLAELRSGLIAPLSPERVTEAVAVLHNRSLIEKTGAAFFLQPVIMEYVLGRFVAAVYPELADRSRPIALLNSHPLMIAQARDYIRESQRTLIVQRILELLYAAHTREAIDALLRERLAHVRAHFRRRPGYAAGNVLTLLLSLGSSLRGADLSGLTVWQVDFQGAELQDVSFTEADLSRSAFTETLGNVLAVTFAPRGDYLAISSSDGEIGIWETTSWRRVVTCRGHLSWVRSVRFSADGAFLVSSSDDQTVKLWDAKTGGCLATYTGHSSWARLALFSPDERTIASFADDNTVILWDARTGERLRTFDGHTQPVSSGCFERTGQLLISGSNDRTLRLWDVASGEQVAVLGEHAGRIWAVAVSPDGRVVASGGDDGGLKLWDLETRTLLQELRPPAAEQIAPIRALSFSPDGKTLASGGDGATIWLWDLADSLQYTVLTGHAGRVRSVAFSPDGQYLVSGGDDQTARLWSAETAQCVRVIHGYTNRIWSVGFSHDGATLASGSDDGIIRIWDPASGQELRRLNGHTGWIWALAHSLDGATLCSAGDDQTIRVWELATGQCRQVLVGHSRRVRSIAIDASAVLLASGSEDETVKLWDLRRGLCLGTLQGHTHRVHSVALRADGALLASGSADGSIRLWEMPGGACVRTLRGHRNWVWAVAFSPDGKMLASASADKTVRLWDAETGEALGTLEGHDAVVLALSFHPSGALLATGTESGAVRLWDLATRECLRVLRGHANWVWSVPFSPGGDVLASSSEDETICLWDVATGACLRVLRIERPYERMSIARAIGLTAAQRQMLKALGATE